MLKNNPDQGCPWLRRHIKTYMLAPEAESHEDDREITLKEYLEEQRRLELEAAAALPYKFDQCTFKLGPMRQYLHVCQGCPNYDSQSAELKAFCYSCAVSCHEFSPEQGSNKSSHKIEEIWARRDFVCDCPSTGKCQLVKPSEFNIISAERPHVNSYHSSHNFSGKYCFCDHEGWSSDDRTMYQCECCEDWFHDDCVARRRLDKVTSDSLQIPSEDSFEDFICCECVEKYKDVFGKLKCSEMVFCYPKLDCPLDAPNASIFLKGAWRLELRRKCEKDSDLAALFKAHNLEHLIRDEEAVYNPEEDDEAKASLYERKLASLKAHHLFAHHFPFC